MSEKCINKNIGISTLTTGCCGCETMEGFANPSANPYISYRVGRKDMLSYSPTQWIIPIKFYCGCSEQYIPGSPSIKTETFAKIHNVTTVGANPANVSFVYLNNASFCNTLPAHFGGQTYCQTLNGWAMIVDKDLTTVLTAKDSGVNGVEIEVRKCATSTPFVFNLKTEYFFADNFRRYSEDSGGNCNNTGGSTQTPYLWAGAENTATKHFLDENAATGWASCSKDMTTYYATPVCFFDKCNVSMSSPANDSYFQALKTIQDIRVVGSNEPLTWGTNTPNSVWTEYDDAKGLWQINIDKDGGSFHTNTTTNPLIASEFTVEIDVLESSDPCDMDDPTGGFTNAIVLKTITRTLTTGEFNFISSACPF